MELDARAFLNKSAEESTSLLSSKLEISSRIDWQELEIVSRV
jgi:hypothetical protein